MAKKLNKQSFTQIMNRIVELQELGNKFDDIMSKMSWDGGYPGIFHRHEALFIDMLEEIMDDKSEWIQYWLYELDCGTKYKPGCITFSDKNVKLKTLDDLWDILNKL